MGAPLEIADLSLTIGGRPVLHDIDLALPAGGAHGLVGESGSGKSMTALATIGLLPHGSNVNGSIRFDGRELTDLPERERRALRGARIGMVFQEPMTALNPMQTVDAQVAETILLHEGVPREAAMERARAHLDRIGIGPRLASRHPHALSGGQRQRVVVAIATVLHPDLVIADEPTTALDVVRQREVLDLLSGIVREDGSSLLLITHDLAVVAEMVDAITVLRHGRVVEATEPTRLLDPDRHAYTRGLVEGSLLPVPEARVGGTPDPPPALELRGIGKTYGGGLFGREATRAVDGVDLVVPRGGAVGLVGGSGCGKSTLARIALALDRPSEGEVHVAGTRIDHLSERALVPHRKRMQIVFQDPNGSFDPRCRVGWSVAEPMHAMDLSDAERAERVATALGRVHLSPDDARRYPHEFSGGQRQRLAIARAIVNEPTLIVADEPVSALDVSIRAAVLALFTELRETLGLACLFISHDLTVVRAVTDEVAVMEAGRIVERGRTADVLREPTHEATRALVAAAPDLREAVARRRETASDEAR